MISAAASTASVRAIAPDRHGLRARAALVGLTGLLVVAVFAAIGIGALAISPGQAIGILAERLGLAASGSADPTLAGVLFGIRLPRVLLAAVIGAGLAAAGVAMQGIFRNPLADPGLVGVSSGAALAATAAIVLGQGLASRLPHPLGLMLTPVAAFVGSVLTTFLVWRLATRSRQTALTTMLLAGIAINAIAGAGTGILTYMASDPQLRNVTFWSMGSLNGATWTTLGIVTPFVGLTLIGLPWVARALNVMALGEADARHLGIAVERIKRLTIVLAALAVGASVAMVGMIGFIGLVAPHLVRLMLGPDHRVLLPGASLVGATLLVLADLASRVVVAPAELPIGILTAFLGGPFFLWLLLRAQNGATR
ncbi:iron ABC transporter permease [bacterium]|nr:iron ABC transporter permease [bacterium]